MTSLDTHDRFFKAPVLNSPYEYPARHWELDQAGQPTHPELNSGVNHLGTHGRWAFAEFTDVYRIEDGFAAKVEAEFERMLEQTAAARA